MSFSGRDTPIPSILNCPGPTLFTIPFRTKINRAATLYALYDNIRQNIIAFGRYGPIGLKTIMTASPDAANACNFRSLFAVQPRHIEPPTSVFGDRLTFKEDMGRVPLIFECWIVEGGVDLVVEFNTSSLGREEMGVFVDKFVGVFTRMIEAPFDTPLDEFRVEEDAKENTNRAVNGEVNGKAGGDVNGKQNGHANGSVNSHINGEANGMLTGNVDRANGHTNCDVNGYASSDLKSVVQEDVRAIVA